jgi:hypothetical protein
MNRSLNEFPYTEDEPEAAKVPAKQPLTIELRLASVTILIPFEYSA